MDDSVVPEGYTMTFKQALSIVSEGTLIKLLVPDSLMGTTELTRNLRQAMAELRVCALNPSHFEQFLTIRVIDRRDI